MILKKPKEIERCFSSVYFSTYLSTLYSLSKNEQEVDINHRFCRKLFTSYRSEVKALRKLDWLFLVKLTSRPLDLAIDLHSGDIDFYVGDALTLWLKPLSGDLFIQGADRNTEYYDIRDEDSIRQIDFLEALPQYENKELWS